MARIADSVMTDYHTWRLEQAKCVVRQAHESKVNVWNKLATRPFNRASENAYYASTARFEQAVSDLLAVYRDYRRSR